MKKHNRELTITMSDGDKKAEFKTNNFKQEHQLAVIDGLFKFFDIEVDFKEMIDTYDKSGKAFQEFYSGKKEVELTEVNESHIVKDSKIKKYEIEINEVKEDSKETSEHTNTRTQGNVTTYKCHYICPSCGKRANKYIKKYDRTVNCYDCLKEMPVKPAIKNGNLEQDDFGNYFIAGEFKRKMVNDFV